MGIGFMGRSCSVYGDSEPTVVYQDRVVKVPAPNPDPARYQIMQTDDVNNHCVAKIRYPDCTNYEGIKICVYKNMKGSYIREQVRLDPHFSDDCTVVSPIARFEPTNAGHMLAITLCTLMD